MISSLLFTSFCYALVLCPLSVTLKEQESLLRESISSAVSFSFQNVICCLTKAQLELLWNFDIYIMLPNSTLCHFHFYPIAKEALPLKSSDMLKSRVLLCVG